MSHVLMIIKTLEILTFLTILPVSQLAWSFSIAEPKASSVHDAGQPITVAMDLGDLPGVTQVKYFWYREGEDMLQELVENKLALISTVKHHPPFGGTVLVPQDAIGTYRLLAVAEQGGRQVQMALEAIFDEVMIQIKPNAQLLKIYFQTNKPLRFGRAGSARVYDQLDSLGTTYEVPVVGEFSDGVVRGLRSHTTGTAYSSADEAVISVNQDGVLRLMGNGATVLTVKNGEHMETLDIIVDVNDEPNEAPVANAGNTQFVSTGERVILNGLGSYDPDGGSLQYHWSQVRGSKIPLLDPYSGKAKFLAPLVVEERTFRFKLRVTDIKLADSLPAFVDVVVSP